MSRLAGGDTVAMEALIERWERPLLSFIYRYVQHTETTRDLVQETFIRVYHARHRFDPKHPFSGWVFRIAANLCRNQLRWRRRHPESALPAEEYGGDGRLPVSPGPHPAHYSEQQDDILALRRAIRRMPHTLKTALLLHYYEELSYREIAAALGCSQRGVESRLYRARKWLVQRLAPDPSGAAVKLFAEELKPRAKDLCV